MRSVSRPLLHVRWLWIGALLAAFLLVLAVLAWWPRTYTPAQIEAKSGFIGLPVDVVGTLVPDSVQATESNAVRFELQGGGRTLQAHFQGGTSEDLDDSVLLKVHGVVTEHGTLEVVHVEHADRKTH